MKSELRVMRQVQNFLSKEPGFFMRYVLLAFFYKGALLIGAIHARAKARRMNL
jgi:hypothetical protein